MTESSAQSQKHVFDVKAQYLGEPGTKSFKVEFVDSTGKKVSPWHDLPLFPCEGQVTMVVEIPRNTRPKMEVATQLEHNPIVQDLFSDGSLRDLDCPMYWNYGAIPRTWEAPVPYEHHYKDDNGEDRLMSLVGDNDPLDVVDVGKRTLKVGDVVAMKPVGGLALIDQKEIDWKILAVSQEDEHFSDINELEDVDKFYPGTTTGILEFFRWYKTPRGKPLNEFLPNKTFISKKEAMEVIHQTSEHYKQLLKGTIKHDLWTH
uniref:inorganic diphosphatase n=1 Tax=Theileria annulata TaxID=5874 RepID=A0A3B0MQ98_THEAN